VIISDMRFATHWNVSIVGATCFYPWRLFHCNSERSWAVVSIWRQMTWNIRSGIEKDVAANSEHALTL